MNAVFQLWIPILATAAVIFIASSLIHMVFKWHNTEYNKLANEDDVAAALRAASPQPGQYVFPHCLDMKEMQAEAMQKKYATGPVGFLTIRENGPPKMGPALRCWFIYCVVVAAIAGCIAMNVFGAGAHGQRAGCLVGAISFMTFVGGSVQMGIWMGKPWRSVMKEALDGLIYAVISALIFTWLWP